MLHMINALQDLNLERKCCVNCIALEKKKDQICMTYLIDMTNKDCTQLLIQIY